MLLEVKVTASQEWYEEIMPELEKMGFVVKEELGWADPETDGELMGYYFDYQGDKSLDFKKFMEFIQDIEEKLKDSLALPPGFALSKG